MSLEINWLRIAALVIALSALITMAAYLWYYFTFTAVIQQRIEQQRRLDVIETALRKKYCNTLPYPNEAVRKFCGSPAPAPR